MSAPQAYPLQWPAGKPRTPWDCRRDASFKSGRGRWEQNGETSSWRGASKMSVAVAVSRIQTQLDRMKGASLPVVSTNVELRLDGMPRSNQNPSDPGAALYFQLHGKQIALACDTYKTVGDNLAAIAAHLEAMRTAERHGVGSLDEMFRGFQALPASEDWRATLGYPRDLDQAEEIYKMRIRAAHPDTGGDTEEAATLNRAIAEAREHFAAHA